MIETATAQVSRSRRNDRAYLVVFENGSSYRYPLPSPGVVNVGRILEMDLRIDHSSVSRRHARIFIDHNEIRIEDQDSHNGTKVNGTKVTAQRVLMSGDVVAIGEVLLVVHSELEAEVQSIIVEDGIWRRQLRVEVERAVQFQRSVAVLAIVGATSAVVDALRTIDVVGHDSGQLLALLPEANTAMAHQLAASVLDAMRPVAPDARIGVAICPSDASDADNLVQAARTAAGVARAGSIATPLDATKTIELGDRRVLVCHPAMIQAYALLEKVAKSDVGVLILGETGVGKENAAYAVHYYSMRCKGPFIAINCGALTDSLVESQLFGHVRGAFTDARADRPGVFEEASGGTLFLDEVGELSSAAQVKLLRVLDNKTVTRMGEHRPRSVDVRVVAATNRELVKERETGRFRDDLYFRLGSMHVHLPPLRDRRNEIPMLFREFLQQAARAAGRDAPEPSPQVVQRLLSHGWDGNVRELKSVAERVVATAEDGRIELDDLPETMLLTMEPVRPSLPTMPPVRHHASPMRPVSEELEELERQRMAEALHRAGGVKTHAAALIGMPVRTFRIKFKQYGL